MMKNYHPSVQGDKKNDHPSVQETIILVYRDDKKTIIL